MDSISSIQLILEKGPSKATIENVVVTSSDWNERDLEILFGDEFVHFTDATDLANLMVEISAYPSTSKARHAGRKGPIPTGWAEFKASKKRRLWIWNPSTD